MKKKIPINGGEANPVSEYLENYMSTIYTRNAFTVLGYVTKGATSMTQLVYNSGALGQHVTVEFTKKLEIQDNKSCGDYELAPMLLPLFPKRAAPRTVAHSPLRASYTRQ